MDDQFKILHRRYDSRIQQTPVQALRMVPTLNGIPHFGHKVGYGDGNAHSRVLCRMPHPVYKVWNERYNDCPSKLHGRSRESRQCPFGPNNGTKTTRTLSICRHCNFFLGTETKVEISNVDSVVRFWNINLQLSVTKSTKRYTALKKEVGSYSETASTEYRKIYKQIVGKPLPDRILRDFLKNKTQRRDC